MGLKDWIAKNVAGASGYGMAMGLEVVTNGLALGRTLYLGHGTRAMASDVVVFEDDDHMRSEGFTLYCTDPLNRPPMEDSSELSRHTRVAGIAFAATCTFTAASNFMKEANASAFTRSMGDRVRAELDKLKLGITHDLLDHYNRLPRPGIATVLNMEKPGTNDLLSVFLQEVRKHGRDGVVGFQRRGVLGFDLIAIPLAEETVKMISTATQKFDW